jgi:hypothetical protein
VQNTAPAPAETQTEVDIRHVMQAITNALTKASQELLAPDRIRIASVVQTVLSRRDEETARMQTALEHARTGLVQAELIVSDDYGRGSGSDLPSRDCETATEHLVDTQQRADAALRGE